jgi:hypothetical protein
VCFRWADGSGAGRSSRIPSAVSLSSDFGFPSRHTFNNGAALLLQMVRAQVTNGEPMRTKDVDAQIQSLKEDIDFLLLNPASAGYPSCPCLQSRALGTPNPEPRDTQPKVLLNPKS